LHLMPLDIHQRRQPPCPTGSGRRCLGLSRPRHGAPTSATATRTTTQHPPGYQVERPGPALETRATTRRTRDTRQRGHCGHGAGAGRLHVGHGQRGAGHTVKPTDRADSILNSEGSHRAAEEAPPRGGVTRGGVTRRVQDTRASSEAGTRRRPVRRPQPTDSSRMNRRC
jgi:hypothetical protein